MYMGKAFYMYMDEAIYIYMALSTNREIHPLVESRPAGYH